MDALFPPGPQKSLLLGDAPHFKENPLGFMLQSARTYGDLVHFRFGPSHAYLLTNPRDAHYVLVERHDQFAESMSLGRAFNSAMGHDLFAPKEKNTKKPLRRGTFQTKWLENTLNTAAHHASKALELGQTSSPTEILEMMTAQIVAATLLGDVTRTDRIIRLQRALNRNSSNHDFQSPLTLPGWVPSARNRERQRAQKQITQFLQQILDDQQTNRQPSILQNLLAGCESEDQALEETLALLQAGYDAAAQTVAWALALLAQHPEAADALHAEVAQVLGTRTPNANDLNNLVYCEMVLKETMRLHPPTLLVSRQAKRETRLGEYYVPSGSTIFISPYIVHHSPRYFTSPDRFLPERFGESFARQSNNYAYMPFGAGTYAQVEQDYALVVGKLTMALLAQRFRFTAPIQAENATSPLGLGLEPLN